MGKIGESQFVVTSVENLHKNSQGRVGRTFSFELILRHQDLPELLF
jgi:hypothetical protein